MIQRMTCMKMDYLIRVMVQFPMEIVGSIGTCDYPSIAIINSIFEGNTAIGGCDGAISRLDTQDDIFNCIGALEIIMQQLLIIIHKLVVVKRNEKQR